MVVGGDIGHDGPLVWLGGVLDVWRRGEVRKEGEGREEAAISGVQMKGRMCVCACRVIITCKGILPWMEPSWSLGDEMTSMPRTGHQMPPN